MRKILLTVMLLALIPITFASLVFPKETLFFDRLSANDEQIKLINNPDILFTKLGITTKENVTRAKITVQAMPDCPENAPYQENVLQCFYISMLNINDGNIIKSSISFKVPKEWLRINNYDENNIELRRYSYSWNENINGRLSTWKILNTTLVNSSEDYFVYNAESDGFSYFSIIGNEKQENVTEQPIKQISGEVIKKSLEEELETQKKAALITETSADSVSYGGLSIVIIAVLSLLLTIFIPRYQKTEIQKTPFEQLTAYIKSKNNMPEEDIKRNLQNAGWEIWQIDLALNESKK